jgi:hypothetical protein
MSFIFTSYRIKIYLQKCDTSLLIISCGFYMKNNNSWLLTLFPFLLFIVFKLSFKTTFISVFVLCYPLLHTEETLFLHIFATLSLCKWLIFWSIAQVLPTSSKYAILWLCEVKTIFEGNLVFLYKYTLSKKKCVLRVSIPTVHLFICLILEYCWSLI